MSRPEPRDDGVVYRERVGAPWWVWGVGLVLTGTLGIAYGSRLGTAWGVTAFAVSMGLLALLLIATAPTVLVDGSVLQAGRARLPLRHVGRIAPLDAARTSEARGRKADSRAFLCLRGWVPTAILIEVDDVDDPHPYWLVSTRRGRDLAPVLAAARDAARDVAG